MKTASWPFTDDRVDGGGFTTGPGPCNVHLCDLSMRGSHCRTEFQSALVRIAEKICLARELTLELNATASTIAAAPTRSTFHSPPASTPLRCPWPSALGEKRDPEPSHDFEFRLAQDQRRIDRECFLAEFDSLNSPTPCGALHPLRSAARFSSTPTQSTFAREGALRGS